MNSVLLDNEMKKEFEEDWEPDVFNHSDNLPAKIKEKDSEVNVPQPEHLDVLSKSFGHKTFRPMQWKIIHSIISERRDNCAIMTTGYGKSLCYQFPAVYTGGLALIISPLISLMEDQVLAMQVSNIPACLLGSANQNQKSTIDEIFENKYSLVYLTPEFCTGDTGKDLLQKIYAKLPVTLIAIDEAHCVSSWGHDFRFSYRSLGTLKDLMPDVPILAVTATATPTVQEDIIETLKLQHPQITCSGFDRPNLFIAVHRKSCDILSDLRKAMNRKNGEWKFPGSTIVYCITRKQTEQLSMVLNESGLNSLPYHAGLSLKVRTKTHEEFVRDKIDVIVATIAFGMGIDKPDIRNIIHYGASSSIEAYYQEIGRAGRDGLPAMCWIFYSDKDFPTLRFLNQKTGGSTRVIKEKMLDTVEEYLNTTKCRRRFILSYFRDQKVTSNANCCDNCSKDQPNNETYEGLDKDGLFDFTADTKMFLKAVEVLNGKYGINMYISFLRGSKVDKLKGYFNHPLHGSGKDKSEAWWKGIAVLTEKEKYLARVEVSYSKVKFLCYVYELSKKGEQFLKDGNKKFIASPTSQLLQCMKKKTNIWLSTDNQQPQPSTSKNVNDDNSNEAYKKLYQLLMNKRFELATLHECMPYAIASNPALMEMAKQKPVTLEQLRKCQLGGFTEVKIAKFGEEFIKIIRSFFNLNPDMSKEKMSIQDILCLHPLTDMKNNASSHISFALFKSGLTVHEISEKRGVVPTTVMNHLIDVMKLGYPIKLSELEITEEIKNIIVDATKKVDTGLSLLTPIKNICPPDITFAQVKAVVTYLQIRRHLRKLKIPYIEFEDTDPVLDIPSDLSPKQEPSTSSTTNDIEHDSQPTPTQNLKSLIDAFGELEDVPNSGPSGEGENSNFSDEFDDAILSAACDALETSINEQNEENAENKSLSEQPGKDENGQSEPFNFALLDSPKRETSSQEKRKIEESSQEKRKIEESQPKSPPKKKKLKLPPWLMSQRIA